MSMETDKKFSDINKVFASEGVELRRMQVSKDSEEEMNNNQVPDISGAVYSKSRVIGFGLLAAFASINFGYSLSFPAYMNVILTQLGYLTLEQANFYSSILLLGAMFGSVIAGFLMIDTIGRKYTIIISSIVTILGWIIQTSIGCSFVNFDSVNMKALLYSSRFIVGLGVGANCAVVPVYIHEISPKSVFSLTSVFHQIYIGLGFAVAKTLSFLLDTYDSSTISLNENRPYFITLLVYPGVILALTMLQTIFASIIPFSPSYILSKRRNSRSVERLVARNNERLYGPNNSLSVSFSDCEKPLSFIQSISQIKHKGIRNALFTGCGLMLFQQFTGINPIIMNAAFLMKSANVASATMGLMFLGFAMLIGSILSSVTNTYLGRKTVLIATSLGMAFFHMSLSIQQSLFVADHWTNWLAVVFLFAFLICFTVGWGPIPFILNSQIYPHSVVGFCSGIATMMTWFFGFVIAVSYKSILDSLSIHGMFALFTGFCLLAFLFTLFFVPEVKNLSPHRIIDLFENSLIQFNPSKVSCFGRKK